LGAGAGLTIAEASAEPGVSAASVYRNKRRDSMKAIFRDGDGLLIWYKRLERRTWPLPDNWAKNNPQHVLVHRVEESRRAANRRRDSRESRRRLAITPAGTATAASPPDPSNTGPPKSDAAKPDATSRGP
jgi:hypothetical protein